MGNDLDGSACDDGEYCNGTETCTSGVCGSSTGDPCAGPNGDADCSELCNETTDSCTCMPAIGVRMPGPGSRSDCACRLAAASQSPRLPPASALLLLGAMLTLAALRRRR